jgi:hypothetical protein
LIDPVEIEEPPDVVKIELRCHKHPRYDPRRGGTSAIKGGCDLCFELAKIVKVLDSVKRLPTGKFWNGFGSITVPLVLAFKGKGRSAKAVEISCEEAQTLFTRPDDDFS